MHSEPEPEFIGACPLCHAIGVFTEVSMHTGARIIKYACSRCLKTWTIKNVEFGLTGSGKEFSRCEHLSA